MLDFRMKHEGEPPARLVAGLRMRLKEKGLPPGYSEILAPIMAAPEDMDDNVLAEIAALVTLLEKRNVSPEAARSALEAAIAELIESAQSEGDEEEDVTALFRRPVKPTRSLASMVMGKVRAVSPAPYINSNGPSEYAPRNVSLAPRMADALASRIDPRHKPTIGSNFAHMKMAEMAMHAARAAGLRPRDAAEAVRMAGGSHTTSDFPLATSGALEIVVGRAIAERPTDLLRATHEIPAENYLPGNAVSLSASSVPEEVGESGEIRHVTIDEKGEAKPVPRDVAALFRISNKAIVNDRIGLLDDIAKSMTAGAREKQRRMLIEPLAANSGLGQLMLDGLTLFHANHGNLATTAAPPTEDSLTAARLALRSQRGPHGDHLNIQPWALVVPPQLETVAQKLLAAINPTVADDVNPFSQTLELIVEVGLPSATAWYLIGNPSQVDGLAHAFLDGQKGPRVEAKPGWETLGFEYRMTWAFDAKFTEYRSWYRNPGA